MQDFFCKQNFDYDDTKDYRLVVLYTNPRYDVRAPDNGFIRHLNYMDLIVECEINHFCKEEFVVKGRIIFIPVPAENEYTHDLINVLLIRIHKAALAIICKRLESEIKILIHEHAICIRQRCRWRKFVNRVGKMKKWKYPYGFHIIRTQTMFLNGCTDAIDDIDSYVASNPHFEVE